MVPGTFPEWAISANPSSVLPRVCPGRGLEVTGSGVRNTFRLGIRKGRATRITAPSGRMQADARERIEAMEPPRPVDWPQLVRGEEVAGFDVVAPPARGISPRNVPPRTGATNDGQTP